MADPSISDVLQVVTFAASMYRLGAMGIVHLTEPTLAKGNAYAHAQT